MDWSQLVVDAVMVLTGCLGTVFLAYGLSDWAENRASEREEPVPAGRGALPEVINM